MTIEIRDARPEDAGIVAWVVLTALDMDESQKERLTETCAEADTLYSWENTRLAFVDGKPAGGLIAYPGEKYARLRAKTWPRCWDISPETLAATAIETQAGEFYLDSMALLPEYRGLGLGKMLMEDAVQKAAELGFEYASLIVDKSKPGLVEHYSKIGFVKDGSMEFFGHDYFRMKFRVDKK